MNITNSQYLIIEETTREGLMQELEIATNKGYMVVSSNIAFSHHQDKIIYYALMSKKSQRAGIRDIPVLDI